VGIGLAICRRLANVIAGSISAESKLNRGIAFTFRLPSECVVGPYAGSTILIGPPS
jgi:signal transduction histidine kinase